jgi:uncharacterized membrane protein HdeD (DUF308 family)
MRTVRLIAGILLVITGVLHITIYIVAPSAPGSIGMLVFGIIYAVTGLLLFTHKMYAVYLGLILPLIGMITAIIKFGFPAVISFTAYKNVTSMFTLLLIDVIVIIFCAYLILNRKKVSEITS